VNGKEFMRRAKRYAKKAGLEFHYEKARGKGSHATLHVGRNSTVLKRTEIGKGLLDSMLKALEIPKEDF